MTWTSANSPVGRPQPYDDRPAVIGKQREHLVFITSQLIFLSCDGRKQYTA
jgi:hypothetical protein